MSIKGSTGRELRNVSFIIVITIIVSLLSLSIDFVDKFRESILHYSLIPISDHLANSIFLFLVVLLGITYNRWKKSTEKQKELENIFYSINRDVLVVVDESGKIIRCNNSVTGLFGYTVEEVVNQNLGFLYSENGPEPEKLDEITPKLKDDSFAVNFGTGKSKDGVSIPLEVARYNRINDGGVVLLLRDITERRQVEEKLEDYRCHLEDLVKERTAALEKANQELQREVREREQTTVLLRENEGRLRLLVQSASDAIITVDSSKGINSWNSGAEVMFGYAVKDIVGKPFALLFPENFREQNKQLIEQMNVEGNGYCAGKTFEFYGLRKDGSEFPAEISYTCWESKNEINITAIVRDITERRKAQERIKEARDFLEDIFKTSADGIMVTTVPGGEITMINDALEKILGYSREELIGRNVSEFSSKQRKHLEPGNEFLRQLMEHHVLVENQQTWIRKDGNVIEIECNAAILKERGGKIKGAVASIRDITRRKRDEIYLRETKDHLDNLIESSLDGIIVSDHRGIVTRANKSFLELIGSEKEGVLGNHIMELSITEVGTYKSTSGEVVEISEEFFNDAMEMSVKLFEEGRVTHWESYYLRKDGTVVPVEMKIANLCNEQGDGIGAVGIIRDITERRKGEKELKEAKEFLEYVIKSSRDGILITDELGNILSVNGAIEEISGYGKEELVGEHASIFSPVDDEMVEMIMEKTAEMYEKGFSFYESDLKTKDGSIIAVECSNSLIQDDKGRSFGAVAMVRDITDRKKIEDKLLQSEKLKSLGELAGGVAHDFNNVLAAILGRVQLLKMHFQAPPGVEEKRKSKLDLLKNLEIIERASLDGAETVRRVQEFSRKRVDDKDFTQIEINELIENALEYTRVRWKDEAEVKGTTVTIKKELSSLPPTLGSASELREVFTNLIHNGIDAIPQGGTISIKTVVEESTIVVKIEDNGSGIPAEIRNRIFDPFFTTKGVQSTGLGMSISYGIINRHQGTIEVDSTEGTGTTFTIRLPISEIVHTEDKTPELELEIQKKAKILVVEDEEEVRNLIADILTENGHEVITAADGNQGIELFKENDVDIVFSDLGMPGISGWQVAETIKSINKNVPIAIITGWNVDIEQEELQNRGVDFIAMKPFAVTKVLQLVQEGLELKNKFKAA